MNILVVEDNEAVARSMELVLRSKGMSVFITDLGEEALDMARQYLFDAMLLDLSLPDISGFDVLDGLRATGDMLPVLVVTACDTQSYEERARTAGAKGVLFKPFHCNELLEHLDAVMGAA